jgi:hypothetical protein
MDIRFVSSLGPEEEERIAKALMAVLGQLLDGSPLAYVLRIRTDDRKVFEKTHPTVGDGEPRRRLPGDMRDVLF